MYLPFYDATMLLLIPGIILALYAQNKVKSTYERFSKVLSASGTTGAQAARAIMDAEGLEDVAVEMIDGNLSDHYDPRKKVLRLSREVYHGASLASLGVAAHEAGHAIQHADGYWPLNIRNGLVPAANFGSKLAFPLFLLGLFLASSGLIKTGILMFSAVVLFQLVTLPVEFNASKRAVAILEGGGYINQSEVSATKSVLDAAALTYVAAALAGLLNLLRLIMLSRNRR